MQTATTTAKAARNVWFTGETRFHFVGFATIVRRAGKTLGHVDHHIGTREEQARDIARALLLSAAGDMLDGVVTRQMADALVARLGTDTLLGSFRVSLAQLRALAGVCRTEVQS